MTILSISPYVNFFSDEEESDEETDEEIEEYDPLNPVISKSK